MIDGRPFARSDVDDSMPLATLTNVNSAAREAQPASKGAPLGTSKWPSVSVILEALPAELDRPVKYACILVVNGKRTPMRTYHRYSDFEKLHDALRAENAAPFGLPPKWIGFGRSLDACRGRASDLTGYSRAVLASPVAARFDFVVAFFGLEPFLQAEPDPADRIATPTKLGSLKVKPLSKPHAHSELSKRSPHSPRENWLAGYFDSTDDSRASTPRNSDNSRDSFGSAHFPADYSPSPSMLRALHSELSNSSAESSVNASPAKSASVSEPTPSEVELGASAACP